MAGELETALLAQFTPANFPATKETAASQWTALLRKALPPKCVVLFNLSSDDITNKFTGGLGDSDNNDYAGWAICNGSNGTPNLANTFPRIVTGAAGGTGGSDTHTLTASELPSHTHPLNINNNSGKTTLSWANSTVGTALANSLGMRVTEFGEDLRPTGSTSTPMAQAQLLGVSGQTGTIGQAHNNMPAYYQLTALMRVS